MIPGSFFPFLEIVVKFNCILIKLRVGYAEGETPCTFVDAGYSSGVFYCSTLLRSMSMN